MSKPEAATEAAANLASSAEDESGAAAEVNAAEDGVQQTADASSEPPAAEQGDEESSEKASTMAIGDTDGDRTTGPDADESAEPAPQEPEVAAVSEAAEAADAEAADNGAEGGAEQKPDAGERAETTAASTVEAAPGEEAESASAEEAGAGKRGETAVASTPETDASAASPGDSDRGEAAAEAPNASIQTAAEKEPPVEAGAPSADGEEEGALAPASPQLEAVLNAHESGQRLEGRVIGWNKGGFHVVINGVPAFCPKSQIEIDNPKRAAAYVDRTFKFRVLEIKDHGKRVVLTRRRVLIEDREAAIEQLRQKKASGDAIEGKVTSITDFGAFVDVGGGLEGLVHLSQLSRRRVENAREVVQVGQDVQVKVLKIEKGGDRISLSMKALEPDPWHTVTQKFDTGSKFEGTILRKADFGLFVDVGDGLEGLVHSSNLELGKSMDSPDYAEGQMIGGWVREVDPERRRLSLSLREVAQTNPWSDIKSRYTEGHVVTGRVEQVARFGVFVEIEPGLTGLLPFSSLPEVQGPRPTRQFRPGDAVEVVIDAIDTKRRRISLAPVGSKLEGTKSDLREYQKKHTSKSGLGALAAAFEKIQQS
ncbi:MAG TPA: S1 RNA-binding domain-containing protein [Thermoanaerobaculia bacterium]|nr:S1 RNA-binding domain-containing protein [Thermoanaerobaculia bacterium]